MKEETFIDCILAIGNRGAYAAFEKEQVNEHLRAHGYSNAETDVVVEVALRAQNEGEGQPFAQGLFNALAAGKLSHEYFDDPSMLYGLCLMMKK